MASRRSRVRDPPVPPLGACRRRRDSHRARRSAPASEMESGALLVALSAALGAAQDPRTGLVGTPALGDDEDVLLTALALHANLSVIEHLDVDRVLLVPGVQRCLLRDAAAEPQRPLHGLPR